MTEVIESGRSALVDVLFDDPAVGRCLVAPDDTVVRANAAWLRSIGLAGDDVLGASILELFPATRDMAAAMYARARAGQHVEVPRHAQRIHGRESWWDGRIDPIPMEGGIGLLVTAREVGTSWPPEGTPPPRAAPAGDALDFRQLFENMTEGFASGEALFDASGAPLDFRFLEMNAAFEAQSGLRREEVRGRRMTEVLPNLEPSWIERYCAVARSGRPARFESYNRDVDRHFSVYCFSPAPDRFAILFTDVTERKRTEALVREQTALLQAISDSTGDVLYAKDRQGRLRYANPGALRLIGKPLEQVLGRTDLELLEDEGAARQVMENDRRVMDRGEAFELEERVPLPDGTERIWLSHKVPYRDATGAVAGLLGVSRDITERKRWEETLREADRRKSEFLAVLSHELRNPLAPIRNSIHLLDRAPPESEEAERARDVLRRQTGHLARIVDDLLDVTRISRGKIALRRERLDLREVVRRTTDDLASVLDAAGVRLAVSLPPAPIWADGDGTRLTQVLGNLLANAAKFTPRGGSVEVALTAALGLARLTVRDDGVGMEPAFVQRVFEPFAQGAQPLARTAGGLGLGLALVKGLVELHGGTVEARSDGPGRGSEFVVSLPLSAAARPEAATPARRTRRPRKVLVIEDNPDAAQSLGDLLTLYGHEVRVARDGASGLAAAREFRPEVVLCDIGLPDLDGLSVARALRADERTRAARLVALSGYGQAADRARAHQAGFDDHLTKPPELDELMSALA